MLSRTLKLHNQYCHFGQRSFNARQNRHNERGFKNFSFFCTVLLTLPAKWPCLKHHLFFIPTTNQSIHYTAGCFCYLFLEISTLPINIFKRENYLIKLNIYQWLFLIYQEWNGQIKENLLISRIQI